MSRRVWLVLIAALVAVACLVAIADAARPPARGRAPRNPMKARTPSRPPRMPPTIRRPPTRTSRSTKNNSPTKDGSPSKAGSSKPGSSKPGSSKPGSSKRPLKKNKPTRASTTDYGKEFRTYQYEFARRMWKFSHAAYCTPEGTWVRKWVTSNKFPAGQKKTQGAPKPVEVKTFHSTSSTPKSSDWQGKLYGYVVADPNDGSITVAFKGSNNPDKWFTDLQSAEKWGYADESRLCKIGESKTCIKFNAHYGFLTGYLGLQEQVNQAVGGFLKKYDGPLHVTGHSLGGALAVFCGIDMRMQYGGRLASVYTFGQPRAGDKTLKALIKKQRINMFRVVNAKDPVVHIPPDWSETLTHAGAEVWYRGGCKTRNGKPIDQKPEICMNWAPRKCSASLKEYKDTGATIENLVPNAKDQLFDSYFDGKVCNSKPTTKGYDSEGKDVHEFDVVNKTTKADDFKWVPKYVWILKGTPEWDAMQAAEEGEGSFFRSAAGQAVIGVSAAAFSVVGVAATVWLISRRKKGEEKEQARHIAPECAF